MVWTRCEIATVNHQHWPVHPCFLPGECISSWLMRSACANGMDIRYLWTDVFGREAKPPKHLDCNPSSMVMEGLSARSGLEPVQFQEASVIAMKTSLFPEWRQGRMRWVLLGKDARSTGHLQFCPDCLAMANPYFRTVDRLSFIVVCPEHGTPLLDRCPSCGHQVDLVRFGARFGGCSESMCHCRRCGWDLRRSKVVGSADGRFWPNAPSLTVLEAISGLQARILGGLQDGWMESPGGGHVYTFLFLEGFRQVINLLCARSTAPRLLKALDGHVHGLGAFPLGPEGQSNCFEKFEVHTRLWLLGAAAWLLAEWPTRFVSVCKEAGLSASDTVQNDKGTLPYWYVEPLKAGLGKSHVGWRDPSIPKCKQYSQKALADRKFSQRLADREKRLDFIRGNMALAEDLAALAKLMRDVGLYSRRDNLWCIRKSLIKLIPAAKSPTEWWRRVGTPTAAPGKALTEARKTGL